MDVGAHTFDDTDRFVKDSRGLIEDIAGYLYENPELGLQEHLAMAKLSGILKARGWHVETGLGGMQTSFVARRGHKRPCFAFLAEYDALPGIGHGCGHNLIAAASVAAALACESAYPADEHDVSWMVIGTPAEETYGGKIALADAGVFDRIDAAFLAHPGQTNSLGGRSWASHPMELTFLGRTAHAGGNPQGGVNALDACVHAYMMIRNLRNQLRDDVRLAGVILEGGQAQNVIPDRARMRFTVRSKEWRFVEEVLVPRIIGCAQAAADANLATLEWHHHELLFKECLAHPVLESLAQKHFDRLGLDVPPVPEGAGGGTTDVGAVTWVCPTIQIGFEMTDARGHSVEMADATVTEKGIDRTTKAARILASIAVDLFKNPGLLCEAASYMRQTKQR